MKPLVYFVDKDDKDNYVLGKEELNKILEEVYQSGYKDGQSNSQWYYQNPERWAFGEPINTSVTAPYPREINSGSIPLVSKTTITCEDK